MKFELFDSMFTPGFTVAYFLPLIYDYDYEKRYGSLLLKPEIDFKPIDSFNIILGSTLAFSWHKAHGNDYTDINQSDSIGRYFKENNIYIMFKYQWSFDLVK
jgi:hypothetical protein